VGDVRRLLARLNATTARLDGSGGGKPELTPQDIAAALGMLKDIDGNPIDPLAREVFCACWWEDGARLTRMELLNMIALKQTAQWDAQKIREQRARLELHIAEDNIAAKGIETSYDAEVRRRFKQRLADAKAGSWPNYAPLYSVIRHTVLNEITSPHQCNECGGRGELTAGTLRIRCRQCDGTGAKAISDRQRALLIGKDESTYRAKWRGLYEWTYELVRNAEYDGLQALKRALA
jgi:hypothetical protein